MAPQSTPKKVGGEYGDIREGSAIDVDSLNAYFRAQPRAQSIRTPVNVKQFKVNSTFSTFARKFTHSLCSLDRFVGFMNAKFEGTEMTPALVQPHVFPNGRQVSSNSITDVQRRVN